MKKVNDKYLRGLFKNRQELSRLSRKLEAHGGSVLPYVVNGNAVMFDVPTAVKWLLEKFGLWSYIVDEDIVTVAAAVDGAHVFRLPRSGT